MTDPTHDPTRRGPSEPAAAAAAREEVTAPLRAVYHRALRGMLVLVATVAVLGVALGYATSGVPGVWGALIGAAVALVFSGTTVISMLKTADASPTTTATVILGAWLVKMMLLIALFAVLDGMDFYDREVLVVVVLVAVLGSVFVDYRAVTQGRVPYTQPLDGPPAGTGEGPQDRRR